MKKIITIIITLLAIAGVAYVYTAAKKQPAEENMVACTMDAKMCPDGSYVGRQGPNCEFAACPGASN